MLQMKKNISFDPDNHLLSLRQLSYPDLPVRTLAISLVAFNNHQPKIVLLSLYGLGVLGECGAACAHSVWSVASNRMYSSTAASPPMPLLMPSANS